MKSRQLIGRIDKLLKSDCAFVTPTIDKNGLMYELSFKLQQHFIDDSGIVDNGKVTNDTVAKVESVDYEEMKSLAIKLHKELHKHYFNMESVVVNVEAITDYCEEE